MSKKNPLEVPNFTCPHNGELGAVVAFVPSPVITSAGPANFYICAKCVLVVLKTLAGIMEKPQ
jgi:hypothetical protein